VIMRLALVTLWLRASRGDPPRRKGALRYALGVVLVQAAWVGLLFLPAELRLAGFWVLVVVEVLIPAWAEHGSRTTWHPEHITERYGLFTLITLGEAILAASIAVRSATESGASAASLAPVIVGGLLVVFSFWWLYFERHDHELTSLGVAFLWGYGHYFVFASAAAVGAGLSVAVDRASHRTEISDVAAGAAVALPVALFLVSLWFLHARREGTSARTIALLVTAAVLLTPLTGQPVLATGLLMAGLVAFKIARAAKTPAVAGSSE